MCGKEHKVVGIGFGVAAAYIAMTKMDYSVMAVPTVVGTAIAGSLLPDIDHNQTKIGRKRKVVMDITKKSTAALLLLGAVGLGILAILTTLQIYDTGINVGPLAIGAVGFILLLVIGKTVMNTDTYKWITHHRGIMHTLWPPVLIFVAWYSTKAEIINCALFGLLAGYLSHLFADMLTVEGCPILFPFSKAGVRIMKLRTTDDGIALCRFMALLVAVLVPVITWLVCSGEASNLFKLIK